MRIQELLTDDDLYELALLLNEVIWQALMAQSMPDDVKEGYRRPIIRTPIRAVLRSPGVPKRTLPRPKPLYPERTKVSQAQHMATNPKIDPLKGYNARLDNTNVFPVITDKEAEIERKRKW